MSKKIINIVLILVAVILIFTIISNNSNQSDTEFDVKSYIQSIIERDTQSDVEDIDLSNLSISIKENSFVNNKNKPIDRAVHLNEYGVSAAHPLAVKVGLEILKQGGNAVDAAIAVSYVLSVVEPHGSGIGGGGLMIVHPNDTRQPVVFDYREAFPKSSTKRPYKNVGVPGFVKGMEEAHKEFGTIKIKELIEPAIQLAEEGFKVYDLLHYRLKYAKNRLPVYKLSHFFSNDKPIYVGSTLKQTELANTLRLIQKEGSSGFYSGGIAKSITNIVREITPNDFDYYTVKKSLPVSGEYRGYEILTSPAPSSGITLIQALQMVELLDIDKLDFDSAEFYHLINQITNVTYIDRYRNIADPSFVDVDANRLTSKEYAQQLTSSIEQSNIDLSNTEDKKSIMELEEHTCTTHFVIVDKNGMMVSATNSLGNFFGSGIYVGGFFLNAQVNNFSSSDSINKPEKGKRPRTFMAPSILQKDGKPVIGIGSPGGRRIPIMLLEVLIRCENEFSKNGIQDAIDKPRFFYDKGIMYTETDFSSDIRNKLRKEYGYKLYVVASDVFYGGVNSLVIDYKENKIYGGADSRRDCKVVIK